MESYWIPTEGLIDCSWCSYVTQITRRITIYNYSGFLGLPLPSCLCWSPHHSLSKVLYQFKMDLKILSGSPLKKLSFSPLTKKDKSSSPLPRPDGKQAKTLANGFGLLSRQGSERRRWFHKGSRSLGNYCVNQIWLIYRHSIIIL